MQAERKNNKALSFGEQADAYAQARPDYKAEYLESLLEQKPQKVLDVGAGTGKLTQTLLDLGLNVDAVEPDAKMLAKLHELLPDVDAQLGAAEKLPCADHSYDLITFGQAWHWVEPKQASHEIARVLTPGGQLALAWNVRDHTTKIIDELSEVIGSSVAEKTIATTGPIVEKPLKILDHQTFDYTRTLSHEDLVALVTSRSDTIKASEEKRTKIFKGVDDFFEKYQHDSIVTLPYVFHLYVVHVIEES